jgi:hypothetical protein
MLSEKLLLQDISVIGQYETEQIVSKLTELNDREAIDIEESQSKGVDDILRFFNSIPNQPWSYTTHQFGYIAPRPNGSVENQTIQHPGAIKTDVSLKNSQINIRLDRVHIYKYPGGGTHNVMVTFVARNQVGESQESVTFSQIYRVPEGNSAGIAGHPIFIGLNVGHQGLAFECSTINVKNDEDEAVLQVLESPTFQSGLKLLTTAQPAIAPFTTISLGVVKYLAQRHKNVAVQKLYLGLDFENAAMGIRLAEGNYIAVQVPTETSIDWDKWIYKPTLGTIVHKADDSPLEYNYLVFRVSRYQS